MASVIPKWKSQQPAAGSEGPSWASSRRSTVINHAELMERTTSVGRRTRRRPASAAPRPSPDEAGAAAGRLLQAHLSSQAELAADGAQQQQRPEGAGGGVYTFVHRNHKAELRGGRYSTQYYGVHKGAIGVLSQRRDIPTAEDALYGWRPPSHDLSTPTGVRLDPAYAAALPANNGAIRSAAAMSMGSGVGIAGTSAAARALARELRGGGTLGGVGPDGFVGFPGGNHGGGVDDEPSMYAESASRTDNPPRRAAVEKARAHIAIVAPAPPMMLESNCLAASDSMRSLADDSLDDGVRQAAVAAIRAQIGGAPPARPATAPPSASAQSLSQMSLVPIHGYAGDVGQADASRPSTAVPPGVNTSAIALAAASLIDHDQPQPEAYNQWLGHQALKGRRLGTPLNGAPSPINTPAAAAAAHDSASPRVRPFTAGGAVVKGTRPRTGGRRGPSRPTTAPVVRQGTGQVDIFVNDQEGDATDAGGAGSGDEAAAPEDLTRAQAQSGAPLLGADSGALGGRSDGLPYVVHESVMGWKLTTTNRKRAMENMIMEQRSQASSRAGRQGNGNKNSTTSAQSRRRRRDNARMVARTAQAEEKALTRGAYRLGSDFRWLGPEEHSKQLVRREKAQFLKTAPASAVGRFARTPAADAWREDHHEREEPFLQYLKDRRGGGF